MNGMKSPRLRSLIWIGLCSAACLFIVACHKTDATQKPSPQAAPLTRLKWNLKTLVDAYQIAGHTNPKWDGPARRALAEFARIRSLCTESNEAWGWIISTNCIAATDAGCDDPMIRYLYIRFCMNQTNSSKAFVDAFYGCAQGLEQSSYPGIRKYYAWQRAADQVTYTYGYGTNIPPEILRLGIWQMAERNFLGALADRTMPPEEVYDAGHDILETWKGAKNQYSSLYYTIEKQLPDAWTNVPVILLLKGEAYIEMAWYARGDDYANTVTDKGWKLFGEGLALAENALTNAWNLNPKDKRIPLKMIAVELGLGRGRDRMELWFNRAMAIDPNYYDACSDKLNYLKPKWYGSADDMLAFGRECVENKQWGGNVPLILLDAHYFIQREFVDDSEKTNYWKQPEVWLDIKDAFDRFFEANPDDVGWHHKFAWYAYQCGQWNEFNHQLSLFSSGTNYDYFGGKDKFDQMVALAGEHAGETQTNLLTASIELKRLVTKIHAGLDEGKTTETDFADDLKAFDTLLARHKNEKTDAPAQILFTEAMLCLQLFDKTDKGVELIQQLKADFPNTRFAQNVDQILAAIQKQGEAKKINDALATGTTFPDFSEKDLAGQPLSIANCKGKVVLVDFWATWCGPCVTELPKVVKIYDKHHGQGFEIIGISLDEDQTRLAAFIRGKNMTWPQFFDGMGWGNKLALKYGIQSIPATFLLDGSGKIIGRDLHGEDLEAAVAKALANN
jgi:thiol-disulfide isomerase/thioredoxin